MSERYERPDWFTKHLFNPIVAGLTRVGVPVAGSRVLEVTGRTSGAPRRTPVNPLDYEGRRYLVAPRGNTQWVRNVRANPRARLLRRGGAEPIELTEVPDEEKPELLRAYLERWKWEVGQFFGGVGPDASDDELRAIGSNHPCFRIEPANRPEES